MTNEEYESNILKWRQEMDTNLRRENGWLALAGLFWLRTGENIIGSDPESDILLPARAPKRLGVFDFDGNNVTLKVEAGAPVEVNGMATKTALLDADQEDVPSFITFNEMRMVVVRRSKGVGIRLWDNTREERRVFPPREWYPVKEEWRVLATYTRYEVPKVVKMPDILGAILDEHMEGFVTFEMNGHKHELIVSELPDRRLWIQFMDETNGNPTYPSGRYHYTEPHEDGNVFIDFNKAYSPPCAFTDYATCTFPPQENHLHLRVEAGEIYPEQNH
ncbi:MAG: hypothetical protein C3F07_12785 [Anaerolineales bacterium]|nr:DUF1684 domain-containing protein [Anaerolineae bacterium]PWB71982.1 MAG: hypothetical protein C3F07_12785 [Anaerolineales bacterium]